MKRTDVVCFGGEDWWYHNRGHTDMQLMRRFAKHGTTLYVNSIVMQKPSLGGGEPFTRKVVRKVRSVFTGLKKSDAGFWVYSPFSLPVHHIVWARHLNEILLRRQINHVSRELSMSNPIVWVVCPVAYDTASRMRKSRLVYQRTDRFEDYPNVDIETITAYDRRLKAEADLTIFVSTSLHDEEAGQCKRAIYLDHGVDFEMFAVAEQKPDIPADIQGIPKPIVGYFGALDGHKLDTKFIEAVAGLLPNMSFVFVGKASSDCSSLSAKENIWTLGQKTYEQIPDYGKCFDVAIIPWRNSRWTQAASPIKLKEYLSLGKPLVSTPAFAELQQYLDVVYVADTPKEFAQCITKALDEDSPERIAARRKKVEKASWDGKAELVLQELFTDRECDREAFNSH